MRLSHPIFSSVGFHFSSSADLLRALEGICEGQELEAVANLYAAHLPPITSARVLATILGINPGLIWSFQNRTSRYYREFNIKKGQGVRAIQAPRVALKLIQKWFSVVLGNTLNFPDHVYGFVKNRSHLDAAMIHLGADWLFGVDIRDFFRSTPKDLVQNYLEQLGYPKSGARLLADLTCLNGFLAQGAPSSPVLSNLCISDVDRNLQGIAEKHQIRLTRYADDIVFSGMDEIPDSLRSEVENLFLSSPWQLAPEKMELWVRPHRLKVHGILVDGPSPRLTKGYRNKLRAFHHILKRTDLNGTDRARLAGHVNYSNYVERVVGSYLRKHQALNLDDMF